MTMNELFPAYTPRKAQQKAIARLVSLVEEDQNRQSRAALIYGKGGVGKTYFVRNLSKTIESKNTLWLKPIDVDDSEFWLLVNLERRIAQEIGEEYFREYPGYLSHLPEYERQRIGHETVLAYLRKGDDIFVGCYNAFIRSNGKSAAIILDTIEAIRGTDTLTLLIHWMKRLEGTLFVLSGRPIPESYQLDPVITELEESPAFVYDRIELKEFTHQESLDYLHASPIVDGLNGEAEVEKLALLSQGRPLWLALTVYYLDEEGMPDKALQYSVDELQKLSDDSPFFDEYIRELLTPYRDREFWHEAILRLGVARRRMDNAMWLRIMRDMKLPDDVSGWDEAWEEFIALPWVRTRANQRYVTLHDALAEELASRYIPKSDKDKDWRNKLWTLVAQAYDGMIAEQTRAIAERRAQLEELLEKVKNEQLSFAEVKTDVLDFEAQRLELSLLQSVDVYYQILSDWEAGCERFIEFFDQALKEHQYHLAELLWLEMQRFLPGEITFDPLEDIVRPEIEAFQSWYQGQKDLRYRLMTPVSRYLSDAGRANEADEKLTALLEICKGDAEREYQLLNLRGNACMRIPGRAQTAEGNFIAAHQLTEAESSPPKVKALRGHASKELGFYYRSMGHWEEAADRYRQALHLTSPSNLAERAAIQSNYAYVQALIGLYQAAHDLIESALEVRRKLGLHREVGMSLSVKGEVYRYAREHANAWEAYREAEAIFDGAEDWSWLGLVRQEMAICLYQAYKKGEIIGGYTTLQTMLDDACRMIATTLDLCKDFSTRAYPSALNRAARIFGEGQREYDRALAYLQEGISAAEQVSDGWFLFANTIEYVELSFQAWKRTGDEKYLQTIWSQEEAIKEVSEQYQSFYDLRGRWEVLQGYLKAIGVHPGVTDENKSEILDQALDHFDQGYRLIALGYVGSHGVAALKDEFEKMLEVIKMLPSEKQEDWINALQASWQSQSDPYKQRQEASLSSLLTQLSLEIYTEPQEAN